jgi:hypothetical protein
MFLMTNGLLAGGGGAAERTPPIRIGVLTESWGPTPTTVGLREDLLALGYRENAQFVLAVCFTQGDPAALPAAAAEDVCGFTQAGAPTPQRPSRPEGDSELRHPAAYGQWTKPTGCTAGALPYRSSGDCARAVTPREASGTLSQRTDFREGTGDQRAALGRSYAHSGARERQQVRTCEK